MKYLISKAGKMAQDYPEPIADVIRKIAQRYRVKSFEAITESPDKVFHVGEGNYYHGIKTNGSSFGFEVVASHNISGSGMSHRIGIRFQMPNETYLVRIYYYTKYWMQVYRIQEVIE